MSILENPINKALNSNDLFVLSSSQVIFEDTFEPKLFDKLADQFATESQKSMTESQSYQSMAESFCKLSETNKAKFFGVLQSFCKQRQRVHRKLQHSELFNICSARTSIGTICNRKCGSVSAKYCSTHINNPTKYNHVEKRKNRPEKTVISIESIDMNNYFPTKAREFEGNIVLIDENGFIYDRRDFTILAKISPNGDIRKF